ncbi:hypothetical protein BC936DRAFT_136844, partial [Jimgerdemannia flammicorona]
AKPIRRRTEPNILLATSFNGAEHPPRHTSQRSRTTLSLHPSILPATSINGTEHSSRHIRQRSRTSFPPHPSTEPNILPATSINGAEHSSRHIHQRSRTFFPPHPSTEPNILPATSTNDHVESLVTLSTPITIVDATTAVSTVASSNATTSISPKPPRAVPEAKHGLVLAVDAVIIWFSFVLPPNVRKSSAMELRRESPRVKEGNEVELHLGAAVEKSDDVCPIIDGGRTGVERGGNARRFSDSYDDENRQGQAKN